MDFFARLTLDASASSSTLVMDDTRGFSEKLNTLCIPAGNFPGRKDLLFNSGRAVFIGDPVFHDSDTSGLESYLDRGEIEKVIRSIDGFYYLLVIYNSNQKLIISSGTFSILPVFYTLRRDVISVSSSFDVLASDRKNCTKTPDRQYYLEKALFNYPLFDRTPLQEIRLLPSNSYLEYFNSKFHIRKHTCISDFFTGSPSSMRSAQRDMTDFFIGKARNFIPENQCALSLTGGLDSRAVAAIALGKGGVFGAYTYGQARDPDMEIAADIAGLCKMNFHGVILDENYAGRNFWDHGLEFLKKSFGLGNISRAHYHYIVKHYLGPYNYLLTGNFGSEILRPARVAGVVTSNALFRSFSQRTMGELYNDLVKEPALSYLNPAVIKEDLGNIVGEIRHYLDAMPSGLTVNQKFYTYLFEEVFRKYFGAEVIVQRTSVNHRAPFLCFSFIERILQTGFAGANEGFAETNLMKRFRGQGFYASVIEKTNPALMNVRLARGYKPKDLLTRSGTASIAVAYLKRKYSGKRKQANPDYITLSLTGNINKFPVVRDDDEIFNSKFLAKMKSGGWAADQMNFINIMSAVIFRNMLNESPVQE